MQTVLSEKRVPRTRSDVEGAALTGLMDQIRLGSASAFQELMDRLWPELVRFAAWETGDTDEARDVVQEAFIYMWRRRASWVQSGSPRGYLYRVVRNRLLDRMRRQKVRDSWAAQERVRPRSSPPDPADVLDALLAEEAFVRAVDSIPPRRREAFSLVVLRGLTHREAAEALDVSEQTVANQVSTALRTVREALSYLTGEEV